MLTLIQTKQAVGISVHLQMQIGKRAHLVFEKATHSCYKSNQNILMCLIAVGTSKWRREMGASVR